jgi:3-oxoacyl-(acyl-carrier-protein) synthase
MGDENKMILDAMLVAISEVKQNIKELRDEIRADIQSHKVESEKDTNRIYDYIGELRQKVIVMETKIQLWQWLGGVALVGAIGSIISSIMGMVLK